MNETSPAPLPGRWGRSRRDWAISLWVAFLAACGGTFLLFALLDPEVLSEAWVLGWQTDLRLTYGFGFALMYGVALVAARLTAFMISTGPRDGHAQGRGRRQPPVVRDPGELNPDLRGEEWR
ncbi:MAG: hypothetical protein AAGH19_00630 [Pseudomonadota bacterium]